MKNNFPWMLPKHNKGYNLEMKSLRWDPAFHQAALELATEQSKLGQGSVSVVTVVMTLALNRGNDELRTAFRRRYLQLKREYKRNAHTKDRTTNETTE